VEKFKSFSGSHPILFTLSLLISWFLVAAIATGVTAVFFRVSFIEPLPQSVGPLVATMYIILIAWRFGWLRSSGIGSSGNLKVWLIALLAFAYLIAAYSFAFFGDLSLDIGNAFISNAAQPIIFRQIIVGIVEEILFRGVLLYALVRVLGDSKRGLFSAVLLSAVLFGSMHLLQAFAGRSIGVALIAALESTVSGMWWGAFVILWGTMWPIAAIHAGSNAFVLIKGLSYPGLMFSYQEYSFAIILQLPLVVLSLYWLLKAAPRPVIPEIP